MYDKYTPFIKNTNFPTIVFKPERYELWQASSCHKAMVDIAIEIHTDNTTGKFIVNISSNNLEINSHLEFDICYTSQDRIYFATVPLQTNINNSDAFNSFKMNVPHGFNIITREFKDFNTDEPYVMSLFTINNYLAKISFSFENKVRLLEFYAKGVRE